MQVAYMTYQTVFLAGVRYFPQLKNPYTNPHSNRELFMPAKRPPLVILLCTLIFIRAFFVMFMVAFPPLMRGVTQNIPFLSTMTMGWLAIMFGLWMMRRWSLYVLVGHFLIFLAVQWGTLHGFDPTYIFYVLAFVTEALYFRRMT
jgi:hypothetical protein